MLNVLANVDAGIISNVMSMIKGHHEFLKRNTGETNQADQDHYVLNNEGVMSNNRHFIAYTQMEAQPNGDGTTEGQSLLILGYLYVYMATKDQEYLDAAIKYFDAYVTYFYDGTPIPETPQRWVCNWIVNSKEPVLSNYPIDFDVATHSGFQGIEFNFVNGYLEIPHGSPNWGEYLDKATFAFDGHLAWTAINASVVGIKADGVTPDWDVDGDEYDVDWVVDYLGRKVDWDGNVLEEVASEPIGAVQLQDKTVNGIHKFNYAVTLPVEDGGYMLERNVPWHNRPLRVPVNHNFLGNAADAEQWFLDACYILYKLTGEQRYKNAWDSCVVNIGEYADIDELDRFFRQTTTASTPYTEGISYGWWYPSESNEPVITRDENGYIVINKDSTGSMSLEQQAVWYSVDQQSIVRTTFGGVGITATVLLFMNDEKVDVTAVAYQRRFPISTSATPIAYDDKLSLFVQATRDDGTDYLLSALNKSSEWGDAVTTQIYETGILGSREDLVIKCVIPSTSDGGIIGFWALDAGVAELNSLTYRSNFGFDLVVEDSAGWRWQQSMPNTGGVWQTNTINFANWVLVDGQDVSGGQPLEPTSTTFEQVNIEPQTSSTANEFVWYCVNDVPPQYTKDSGYTIKYRITLDGTDAFTALVGDCYLPTHRADNLAYTPGVIPFSNIYQTESYQMDGWHGMPYPGYQHPFIYVHDQTDAGKEKLSNIVKFLWDSQQWYTEQFDIVGPGAAAYLWNRWDNLKYGVVDTFTMYNWGNDSSWSGYQPRAYFSACRALWEIRYMGYEEPEHLAQYCINWATYLRDFMQMSGNVSPTDFPSASAPVPDPTDFTGHMCGLWLAGSCYLGLAGEDVYGLDGLIEGLVDELERNYIVTGVPGHAMDGSWSPAPRVSTGTGSENNGMFFGFWAGEIFRGLGLYLMYKTRQPGADLYNVDS